MVEMATFSRLKDLVDFGPADVANLKRLAPVFEAHGPALTERFYAVLDRYPETQELLRGRLERLRSTHAQWMRELFAGDYGEAYLERRRRIGLVHVRMGIQPQYVEAAMDVIRTGGLRAVFDEIEDREVALEAAQSLLKILDLDLMIINLAYGEERLQRLTALAKLLE